MTDGSHDTLTTGWFHGSSALIFTASGAPSGTKLENLISSLELGACRSSRVACLLLSNHILRSLAFPWLSMCKWKCA